MKQHPVLEPCDGPDDRPGVLLRTPYSEIFIDQLKAQVPPDDRRWWADSKGWWVAEEWTEEAEEIAIHAFGEIQVVDEDGHTLIKTADGQRIRQEGLFT